MADLESHESAMLLLVGLLGFVRVLSGLEFAPLAWGARKSCTLLLLDMDL